MKKATVFVSLLLMTFSFSSCVSDMFGVKGEGNVEYETRVASDFQKITLLTNADVTISRDTGYRVEVEDYQNLIQYTQVKVTSHNLVVSINPASTVLKNSVAKVRIWMPDSLTTIVCAGSGSIDVNASLKDLNQLLVTGSGSIRMNQALQLSALTGEVTGSGSISGSGSVKSLACNVSGSGSLYFDTMKASRATCTISGSGNAMVRPDTLVAVLSGSGNVYYYGSPVVYQKNTGSGQVIAK